MQTAAIAEPLSINASSGQKIFGAMIGVMRDVGPIAKTRRNTSQGSGYQFRGIDDVYAALHEVLAKHGVFTVPEIIEERSEERATRNGGNMIYRILKVAYTFYAEDGSSVRAVVVGEGMDPGDKASNKAMSAAQKYLFLQVFSIPTEESKDSETETPETTPRYDRSSSQREQQAPPPPRQTNNRSSSSNNSNRTAPPPARGNAPATPPPPKEEQAAPPPPPAAQAGARPRTLYKGDAKHFAQIKTHADKKWGITDERIVKQLSQDLIDTPLDDISAAIQAWVLEYKPKSDRKEAG